MKSRVIFYVVIFTFILMGSNAPADESDGDKYMELSQYRKAVGEYKKAIEKNGETAELLLKIAGAYDSEKWYGRSVQYWERYIQNYPDGPKAEYARKKAAENRRWLGINFYNLGEGMDKVIHQLKIAIRHDPGLLEAYYWLGRIYIEDGKFDEAVEILEELVTRDGGNPKAKWLLKEANGMKEIGGEAYVAYREGYKLYEEGKYNEAIKKYESAIDNNPKFVKAYMWIARIEQEQELFEQSAKTWEKVLDLDPGNKRAEWFLRLSKSKIKEGKK
ncbi:MAG TPA: tetratricopeptide repeat protein [bacterium]|nr:tetratricopeptide repeat protein [bacterium]